MIDAAERQLSVVTLRPVNLINVSPEWVAPKRDASRDRRGNARTKTKMTKGGYLQKGALSDTPTLWNPTTTDSLRVRESSRLNAKKIQCDLTFEYPNIVSGYN